MIDVKTKDVCRVCDECGACEQLDCENVESFKKKQGKRKTGRAYRRKMHKKHIHKCRDRYKFTRKYGAPSPNWGYVDGEYVMIGNHIDHLSTPI